MSAYLIITAVIHDRDAFVGGYGAAAARLVSAMGGRYRFRGPGATALEGGPDGASVVISEWPDRAAALAFWNSPEYAAIRPLRDGIADCNVLLIEGTMDLSD
jgi:uncharacterized protein (DUF1330 family)